MDEQTDRGDRNQADAPGNSAASAAGQTPTDKPAGQRARDAVPLGAGTVTDGGGYAGGEAPADATDAGDEDRNPLDSRQHFGGDGARYVAPDEPAGTAGQPRGLTPGDTGYDEAAHPDVTQEVD